MQELKWIIVTALAAYVALVALLYAGQRRLMYFPDTARTEPSAAGLPQAEEVMLQTSDGERVIAWHIPPREGRSVVLYFHGNGGSLALRAARFRALTSEGLGLLALSYRGYGGSTGSPSEQGLLRDAAALYAFAAERYPPDRLVLWGESLGGAVAIALAGEKPVRSLILESPFTSAADIAAAAYPFVPVRLLMLDQFRSDERIGHVAVPVLVMHGERDNVVPTRFGERLFALIRSPKRFVRFANGGHNDLDASGALEVGRAFANDGLND